jgi:glucose-6-phosphate 1-epimerase
MEFAVRDSHRRLEIPGIAEIVDGKGGLPKVRITSAACVGQMYLHGAHITSWKPAGEEEVLFVSSKTRWEDGHAIRGGIPVCFPWFAHKADDPQAPDHGFVRTKTWQLDSIADVGDAITVSMSTESDEATKKWWPAEFRLVLRATFGKELSVELVVTNRGRTSLRFEEALHAYFRVGNIEMTRARTPDALYYIDKTDSHRIKTQLGDIMISSETDSVYLDTRDEIRLEDPLLQRHVCITKENSSTTVVWNPWAQKAHSMSDLGADEWMQMICVEPSNVAGSAVDLAPGQQHSMKTLVRVVDF